LEVKKPTTKPALKQEIPPKVIKKIVKPKQKLKPKIKVKPKVKKPVKKRKVIKKRVPILKKEILPKVEKVEPVVKQKQQKVKTIILPTNTLEAKNSKPQNRREIKENNLEKDYLDDNIVKIQELLKDNLYYPRSARKRGITGVIKVKFTILKNAEVNSIEVISSNNEILSRGAIKTIESLSGEFPKPKEELTIHVPISYKLK
jgi:protein TonB